MIPSSGGTMTNTEAGWLYSQSATQAETFRATLTTQNKFIDKNIIVETVIPAAATPALNITDKGTTDIGIGTVSSGYYPLTASLTGTLSVSTAGWITTAGLSATDSSVTVGRIAQSTLKLGSTTISSGYEVTPGASEQVINIGMGYNTARTVKIKPVSAATQAAATVSISKAAATPTLANTASAVSGKSQVTIAPTTATTGISKYYVAMTATAPSTSFTTDTNGGITRNVNTAGYLGNTSQITASGSTTASTNLYYAPLATAALTVTPSVTVSPTAANVEKTVSGKTQITASPNTGTSTISKYFMALNITAPATKINQTKSGFTAGYLGSDAEITAATPNTTAKTNVYYIPVSSGALSAGNGSAAATATNMQFNGSALTSAPTSGPFITVTGSGAVSVGTTGWIESGTEQNSNTATRYYKVKEGGVSWSAASGTITVTEGYVPASSTAVGVGTLSNTATSGVTYATANSPILNESGTLYINAGYYPNTKITLATLIPDDVEYTNAGNSHILEGYEAYSPTGEKLIGAILTYDGSYTVG